MFFKIKIDPLFIFLTLGVTLSFFGIEDKINLIDSSNDSSYRIVPSDLRYHLEYPEEGYFSKNANLRTFNPDKEIMYSLNGGDVFISAGNKLRIEDFRNSFILDKNTSIRWRHPEGDFPELRSVLLKIRDNKRKIDSDTKVLTYFDEDFGSIPVVSLSIKESDLFDEFSGIMIYGFSSWNDSSYYKDWWYRSANFKERGIHWERNANFQYFLHGKKMIDQNCGIRISGNATRYFPQKSIRIYAKKNTGNGKIVYPFWGENTNKKSESILLRNSGNDNMKTMFADLLIHRLCQGTNVLVQKGFPVLLFLNGNFWGIYNLRQRIDREWIAEQEDVKKKNVTIAEGLKPNLKSGSKKGLELLQELIVNLEKEGMSENNYRITNDIIDVNSFIDYVLFEAFFANNDWPFNNSVCYKIKGGKWRWIMNDLDYSMAYPGPENISKNIFDELSEGAGLYSTLLNGLLEYDEFRKKIKSRSIELLENELSVDRIQNVYLATKEQYNETIDLQIRRWRGVRSKDEWELNCGKNLQFLIERRAVFATQVKNL